MASELWQQRSLARGRLGCEREHLTSGGNQYATPAAFCGFAVSTRIRGASIAERKALETAAVWARRARCRMKSGFRFTPLRTSVGTPHNLWFRLLTLPAAVEMRRPGEHTRRASSNTAFAGVIAKTTRPRTFRSWACP